MQISLKWLNDYVNISDLKPEEVADHLTNLGLEVESITNASQIPETVVCGRVIAAEKHPDADKLKVCQVVTEEDGDPITIVCGAPNARPGIDVAVAQVGSVLPGDFKIKKSKIRGVESTGMLCSEKELELSDKHDGIVELAGSPKLGQPVIQHLGLADTMIELSVTPNRGDCLGLVGVARDLAAKLDRPLTLPTLQAPKVSELKTEDHVKLNIETKEECPRFCALYVEQLNAVSSPAWLKSRLLIAGMRPINLIVDITNYVMLEYGQPIHAYDARELEQDTIQVKEARIGDEFVTLDGETRKLLATDLMIWDGTKPIGLAGIMGGLNSEVKDDTSNIVIEVASFDPVRIRKTSKRFALHTEASHRFERGTDIKNCRFVCERVADLLYQCSKELGLEELPRISATLLDEHPNPAQPPRIALRIGRARKLLGLPGLNLNTCASLLNALGIKELDKTDERLLVEVPSWRHDIIREADLIEEVGRLYGFDKIPYSLPTMDLTPSHEDPIIPFVEKLRVDVAHLGMTEIISYAFIGKQDVANLGITEKTSYAPTLKLKNPINDTRDLMQTTLVSNLMNAARDNRRRGIQGAKLFEIGRHYHSSERGGKMDVFGNELRQGQQVTAKATEDEGRPIERQVLACFLDQPLSEKSWNGAKRYADFYDLKSLVFKLLGTLGITDADLVPLKTPEHWPFLHPSCSALINRNGENLGYMGELHPQIGHDMDFSVEHCPMVLEMDLENLFAASQGSIGKYSIDTHKFPASTRDLAFVFDESIKYQDIETCVKEFSKKNKLSKMKIFDIYQGSSIERGKKSMAFAFSFLDKNKTLTDKEVDKEVNHLISHLTKELSAELR